MSDEDAEVRRARHDAALAWIRPEKERDRDELRKWVMYGDYSNVWDPWHTLIEQWHQRRDALELLVRLRDLTDAEQSPAWILSLLTLELHRSGLLPKVAESDQF